MYLAKSHLGHDTTAFSTQILLGIFAARAVLNDVPVLLLNHPNTLKGPEVFSLNSVSSLLIALKYVEFCLQWPVDKSDSEL